MPRKGKKTEEERERVAEKAAGKQPTGATARIEEERARKGPTSRRGVDLDSWIERNIDDIISRAGLDYLGVRREMWIEVLRDILVDLYGSTSSYKSAEDIAKRLSRNADRIFPVIAARLAYAIDFPSQDLLEFVVTNIGESVLELAPKLYGWSIKLGRGDLLGTLRFKWGSAWTKSRTSILPVACPRCGFNSLMPDLVCLVCGSSVSESELKKSIAFTERLKELLRSASCQEINDLLKYDYVLINDLELKSPSSNRLPIDIEVYLSRSEKEEIKRVYEERCSNEIPK